MDIWHPFTQHGLREPIPCVRQAEGAAYVTSDGRRVIDAISSWWVTTHGHANPRIVAAIRDAAEWIDQIIFAGWTHGPAQRVAELLGPLMPPALTHLFFSDSGSTSVEVALKMALGFWANTGRPRDRIAVLEGGYHGDTIGGMSVGERGVFNRTYAPLLFSVDTLPFPAPGAEERTIGALEALARAPEPPAALLLEPLIQGAGGMRMYSADVLAELRAICARHDILFIADEVMTGWGRTGPLLACEQAGIVPDILCLSKGLTGGSLPLAVTLAIEPVFAAHLSTDRARMFFHSSSYTANPIACAAAAANLEIWHDEPVAARIASLVERQADRLARLVKGGRVTGARQCGTITAVEIGDGTAGYLASQAPAMLRFFRERDVLLRPLGSTIYVMPPYCIDDDDLGHVYDVIQDACGEFA